MPTDDLTARMRVVGARRSAHEIDTTTKSVRNLDKHVARVDKTSRKAKEGAGFFTRGLRGITESAGPFIAALGIAGVTETVTHLLEEFRDAQKITRQTQAVLKSTGGSAKVSAKEIEELTVALSNKTGIDRESIQDGENMLLTFTSLRNEAGKGNDMFTQASKIMVDLGAAMHKGPRASSIMLGKALQDPIRGMTSLRRVGVNFNNQQTDQIKKMAESGNLIGAQKRILKELNKEFGGSAAAQADPIDRVRVAWKNLQVQMGEKLWPVLAKGMSLFATFLTGMEEGTGAGGKFARQASKVGVILGVMFSWLGKNRKMVLELAAAVLIGVAAWRAFMIIQTIINFIRIGITFFKLWRAETLAVAVAQSELNVALLANPIGLVVVAIALLVAGLIVAYNKIGWFHRGVNSMWGNLKAVFGWAKKNWPLLAGILAGPFGIAAALIIKHFGGVRPAIEGILNGLITAINSIIGVINRAIDAFNKLPFHGDIGKIGLLGHVGAQSRGGRNAAARRGSGTDRMTAVTGHAAAGGLIRRSGVYEVGERGRERVHLPAGSVVEPNGGFGGDLVVPVTVMMPNGDVLARHVARSSQRKKATR